MNNIKTLALLIAGSIIGLVGIVFVEFITKHVWEITCAVIILILIGVGLLTWLRKQYIRLHYVINKRQRKVAFYAPYSIDADTAAWVEVSIRQITNNLRRNKIRFSIISKEEDFEKYPCVINPYGETYPEKNAATLSSIDTIFNYVKNGGVYVNAAGVPFYYAYESNLQRRVDTTPLMNAMTLQRAFLDTIVAKRLQVILLGLTSPQHPTVERVFQVVDQSQNFYSTTIPVSYQGTNYDYSPYIALPLQKRLFRFLND